MALNSNYPLISIGMPVYNGKLYIERAIDSLLRQTYINYELIISDNRSSDNTWLILEKYAKEDSRVILHRQDSNLGIIRNFKFVLEQARGEYFMWLASDDCISENYIEKLLELHTQHARIELACPAIVNITPHGQLIPTKGGNEEINFLNKNKRIQYFLNNNRSAWFNGLYRRKSIKEIFTKFIDTEPALISADRLLLYYYILNDKIAVTDSVILYNQNKTSGHTYRPTEPKAYFIWSFRFVHKALVALHNSNLSIYEKISIGPIFFKILAKLLYSPRYIYKTITKKKLTIK